MLLRSLLRVTMVLMLAGTWMVSVTDVGSQTSGLDGQTRANLAAIPLTTDDLPDGYGLVGEAFLSAEQVASGDLDAGQISDAGFAGMYASVYQIPGEEGAITSYVSIWDDADSAATGFELLEDEAVTDPNGTSSDEELDAGDGPAELTTDTEETDGGTLISTDATFVVDRYVVGVVVATAGGGEIGADSIAALIEAAEARASTVTGGGAPGGIDLSLAMSTLEIGSLGTEVQAGFLSPTEAEALYGVSGSSLSGLQSSWVSLVAAGEDGTSPFVVVGVSAFEDGETSARVVEQSAELVPAELELQPVDDYGVDGTDGVRGYSFVSPATADATEANSFRAVAQSGDQVIVVDVQGAASVDEAQAAVTELLTAQLACGDGDCAVPDVGLGG